ncbi:hypothetical protein NC653_009525 [Populus alba x Populus x berolinensis]|uniref:Uncharacterized protein n=2 Tax=Populus TaxID=3689 RepID=A0A4U5QEE4_POPAL|nr:hypothetical protein NC653_009525 [Populus alba x Populus x berolinensis]TKS08692.1 hypothetical protein D5086_0000099910 [Populus alba]
MAGARDSGLGTRRSANEGRGVPVHCNNEMQSGQRWETKIRSGSVPLLQAVEFVEAPGSLLFHVLTCHQFAHVLESFLLVDSIFTCMTIAMFFLEFASDWKAEVRASWEKVMYGQIYLGFYVPDDLRVDGCDPGYGGCHEAMMRVVAIVMIMAGTLKRSMCRWRPNGRVEEGRVDLAVVLVLEVHGSYGGGGGGDAGGGQC